MWSYLYHCSSQLIVCYERGKMMSFNVAVPALKLQFFSTALDHFCLDVLTLSASDHYVIVFIWSWTLGEVIHSLIQWNTRCSFLCTELWKNILHVASLNDSCLLSITSPRMYISCRKMARTCRYTVGIWIVFASCTDQVHLKRNVSSLCYLLHSLKLLGKNYNLQCGKWSDGMCDNTCACFTVCWIW